MGVSSVIFSIFTSFFDNHLEKTRIEDNTGPRYNAYVVQIPYYLWNTLFFNLTERITTLYIDVNWYAFNILLYIKMEKN